LKKATSSQLEKALALQNAGELDAAQTLFSTVLKTEPKNAVALYSLAAIESGRKNFDAALKYIQPVTVSHPNFAQAHLAKSVILFNLGKYDDALKAIQRAIHLEPSLPNAKEHLETVKVGQGMKAHTGAAMATSDIPIDPQVHALTQQGIAIQATKTNWRSAVHSAGNFL
jgi:tetratricopeptide (TPR) repeat protein